MSKLTTTWKKKKLKPPHLKPQFNKTFARYVFKTLRGNNKKFVSLELRLEEY